jgi:hypothetical protein
MTGDDSRLIFLTIIAVSKPDLFLRSLPYISKKNRVDDVVYKSSLFGNARFRQDIVNLRPAWDGTKLYKIWF